MGIKFVNTIATKTLCISLSNLADMLTLNHGERMDPIDFGVQKSKVKVTMDIYGKKACEHNSD